MALLNNCNKHCKPKRDKIIKNFRGINGINLIPADANNAVGEIDYITVVNSSIVFYDKKTNKINAQFFLSLFTGSTLITPDPFFPIT